MFSYDSQLSYSIAIRLIAFVLSIVLLRKIRDWRIALLSVMLIFMAGQQLMRLTEIHSELLGFAVSFMALLVTIFVGKLILEQQRSDLKLLQLNEYLEQQVAERTSELDKSNIELKKALSEVKVLSGMLPMCASCKKIRDDDGYWQQIETYITEHSETKISHGICPDCIKKLYPQFSEEILSDNQNGS
ncbi:MAG: hypothetical protein AB7U29_19790 [Desulfobulbus sp.]